MTILPDDIDDATGERIEGTSKVIDTRFAKFEHEPQEIDPDLIEEINEEDLDAPEHTISEVELADISDEVHNTSYEVNEEMANHIASLDIGDSPAAVTIQFLAHKVYQGELSPAEAFSEAIDSGINPDKLAFAYNKLKQHFE